MANENKTYFAKAASATKSFSYKDIFSNVFSKHSRKDMDQVFSAGLSGHIPERSEMLTGWQKPWVFSRVLMYGLIAWIAMYLLITQVGADTGLLGGVFLFPAAVVPVATVIFFWEMNIPRNIPIYDVLKWILLGGILGSFFFKILNVIFNQNPIDSAIIKWFIVGVVEELEKLAVIAVILRKSDRCWGLNGLLIGAAVGCGFAIFETNGYALKVLTGCVLYDANQYAESLSKIDGIGGFLEIALSFVAQNIEFAFSNLKTRGLFGIVGHVAYAAPYGCALALAKGKQKLSAKHFTDPTVLITLFASILIHAFWDYFSELQETLDKAGLTALSKIFFDYGLLSDLVKLAIFAIMLYGLILWVMRKSVHQVVAYANGATPVHQDQVMAVGAANAAFAGSGSGELVLECVSGELSGQTFTVRRGTTVKIGRGSQNNVQYSESAKGISRVHCSVSFDGSQAIVTDLGSTHGTFFANGLKFQPNMKNPFKDGETFYLASPQNTFRIQIR